VEIHEEFQATAGMFIYPFIFIYRAIETQLAIKFSRQYVDKYIDGRHRFPLEWVSHYFQEE